MVEIDRLRDELIARRARIVAIDGAGGSGKSTLARRLAHRWEGAVVIELDDFWRPAAERVRHSEVPGAHLDRERLTTQVLVPLSSARAARYQRYDWSEDQLADWQE